LKPVRRGGRRRVNPNRRQQYSRRVENARFEDRESFAVREKTHTASKNEEIFNAEASVFRGPADINQFYSQEKPKESATVNSTTDGKSDVLLSGGERDVFGRRLRPFKEGKRVHLNGASDPIAPQQDQRPFRRVVKRPRQKSTTEQAASESFISPTTYRPLKPVQFQTRGTTAAITTVQSTEEPTTTLRYFPTTTTEEPELVTASDEEIEKLRKKSSEEISPSSEPELLSVKVTPKSFNKPSPLSFKKINKPIKMNSDEESGSTRSPDYDYTYYDTDLDNDYIDAAKVNKYGKKSTKVIIKS